MRGDPLWPAGHLPLKGGDYRFSAFANFLCKKQKPGVSAGFCLAKSAISIQLPSIASAMRAMAC
ncbi:hypothetical protein ABID26_007379 [Mesorhizobium shonense]|uniref:Lytic murein transglycosylase n=1 Tax=Mesorhizobium shonense TaxID=1209948 RepID=A0ABV2I6M4_9HYPH